MTTTHARSSQSSTPDNCNPTDQFFDELDTDSEYFLSTTGQFSIISTSDTGGIPRRYVKLWVPLAGKVGRRLSVHDVRRLKQLHAHLRATGTTAGFRDPDTIRIYNAITADK